MSENSELDEFDKLVKDESGKPRGDIFCPVCGSSRLYYFVGFQAGQVYECKDCNYHGPVCIEDGSLASKIRENWIKKKEKNSSK